MEKLAKLKADGVMSEEEFSQAKARLLDATPTQAHQPGNLSPPAKAPLNVNQWAIFLHLSQLSCLALGPLGIAGPIVMWQMKKDESSIIDQHGKNATNWMISWVIYFIAAIVLCAVVIGFILVPVVFIIGLVFPILGALKASEGEIWKYPLTIKFIK